MPRHPDRTETPITQDRPGSHWDFLKKLTPGGRRELQKRRAWEVANRSFLVNQLGKELWQQTAGYDPGDTKGKGELTIKGMQEVVASFREDGSTYKGLTDIEVKTGIKQALVRQFTDYSDDHGHRDRHLVPDDVELYQKAFSLSEEFIKDAAIDGVAGFLGMADLLHYTKGNTSPRLAFQLAERHKLSEQEKSEAVRRLVAQTTTRIEDRFAYNILGDKMYIEADRRDVAQVTTNPQAFEFAGPELHEKEECLLWSTDTFAQRINPVVGNTPDGARLRAVLGKLFQTKIGRAQAALIRSELEGIRRSYPTSNNSDGGAWKDVYFKYWKLPPTERLDGVLECYINKVDFKTTGSARGRTARVDESLVVKEIGKSILATAFREDGADSLSPSLKRVASVLAAYPELPTATIRAGLIEGLANLLVTNNVKVSGSMGWERSFRQLKWANTYLQTELKDRQGELAGIDQATVNRAVEIAASSQFYIAEVFYNSHKHISESRDLYDLDVNLGGLDLYFSDPHQYQFASTGLETQEQSNLDKIFHILQKGKEAGLEVNRNEVARNSLAYLLSNKRGPLFGDLDYLRDVIKAIGADKTFLNSDLSLREAITHFAGNQKPSVSPKLVYQSLELS